MSEIKPIAHIYSDYSTKFGIPRQSGLISTVAKIVFVPEFRSEDAIRGLEGYSHIWLIWEFSENKDKKANLTVRPPRLGGNIRMGVFATRSPFRPNSLGLSSVEIEKIEIDKKDGPVIFVKGADILDGTPIFDIKPYLPYTDSHPNAKSGFSNDVFSDSLEVIFDENTLINVEEKDIPILREILSQDPRPHYHEDEKRVYAFEFSRYKINFTVKDTVLTVKEITVI